MIRKSLDDGVQAPSAAMWSYSSVALILGRSQKSSVAMLERAGEEGIDVVVRAAGGGAVIAGPWMCSHTVLVPPDHAFATMSLPRSYEAIGAAWRRALGRLGIPTDIAPRATAGMAGVDHARRWACFASLSCGELVGPDNRKIVGLAQVRRRNGVAICAGLLLTQPDWPTSGAGLARAGRRSARAVIARHHAELRGVRADAARSGHCRDRCGNRRGTV